MKPKKKRNAKLPMFNWIYFGVLWAASGFLGWRMKVKRDGGTVTTYDAAMFIPSLIVGPLNLLFAIIYR